MSAGGVSVPAVRRGSRIAGITVLRWVRPRAGRLESPRHQARTVRTWELGTGLVRAWANDPRTAHDFYDRAIRVRPRWTNGLVLPEYGWSVPEAMALTDLGATIFAHIQRNYANNRLQSPRASMGRQVLLRCAFTDGIDGPDELAVQAACRAVQAYCGEDAPQLLEYIEEMARRAGIR